MTTRLRIVGAIFTSFALMAGMHSVAAHHSTTMFDRKMSVTIDGTVKEIRWVNPHVSLLIYGTLKEGEQPTDWLLEMTSPSVLGRLGWTRTTLKPGDRVRAQVSPLRDSEQHGGALRSITSVETGKTYSTNFRDQEDPEDK